jgi:hypothetical protein
MRARAAGALAMTIALGCQSFPGPEHDRGQVVVELAALPKEGLARWKPGSSYDEANPNLGPSYERVDYRSLPDMIVLLSGANLDDSGPVPREAELKIERRTEGLAFDHQQLLLGPHGLTRLSISNTTDRPLSLYTAADHGEGFDVEVAAGARVQVVLDAPGAYPLRCAEEDSLECQLVVAPTSYARSGHSGESVFFDRIPPGDCVLAVLAPRLPPFTQSLAVRAGERITVAAQLSVNTLPHLRPR